jgi:hypothetical protein
MRALVGLGITVISNPSKMPRAHAATEMVEDRTAEIFDAPEGGILASSRMLKRNKCGIHSACEGDEVCKESPFTR